MPIPEPVSPLSSSSSILSPIRRHRRSSSQNSSSSSSTPRSVIKTPSPLPTNHVRHVSTSSEEDERKEVEKQKSLSNLIKAKTPIQKIRKAQVTQKSPYISDSDSDIGNDSEKKTSAVQLNDNLTEADNKRSKKRVPKKVICSRSISSSSNSPSPARLPVDGSPKKVKHKKGRKTASVEPSSVPEQHRTKRQLPENINITTSNPFPCASSIIHAPPPISPLGESPPSSPGSNSYDKQNLYREDDQNKKFSQGQEEQSFLHPSNPSRLLKRPRVPTPKKSTTPKKTSEDQTSEYIDTNIVKTELKVTEPETAIEGENVDERDLERVLNDDAYYPVQENHKDFIPISKFKTDSDSKSDYVEFLLLIQVKL